MANPNKEHDFFLDQKYFCFLTSCQNAVRMTGSRNTPHAIRGGTSLNTNYSRYFLFKEYLGAHYQGFIQLVEIMSIIQDQLQLNDIPHYSIL